MQKRLRWLVVAMALLGYLLIGCSVAPSSDSSPAPPAAAPARPPAIPDDGVTLATLGFLNGPIAQFSLPRTTAITAKVDQPNNVVAVVSSPPPADVASYLRRALPEAGFTITADDPAAKTMTFIGSGWNGSFTGDGGVSAVLLRPQ